MKDFVPAGQVARFQWTFAVPTTTPVATLNEFADYGIDGVEAFYATHNEEQTRALHAAARERGLVTTGSADFHGPMHDHFNRFRAFDLYGLEPDLGRLGE